MIEEEAQKAAIKKNDKQPVCKTYLNHEEACVFLGCGRKKIWELKNEISEEIENGRYSPYALSDNMIQRQMKSYLTHCAKVSVIA